MYELFAILFQREERIQQRERELEQQYVAKVQNNISCKDLLACVQAYIVYNVCNRSCSYYPNGSTKMCSPSSFSKRKYIYCNFV